MNETITRMEQAVANVYFRASKKKKDELVTAWEGVLRYIECLEGYC